MSSRKPMANPLLASGGQFSLADSFGVTATLPAVAPAEEDSFLGGPATPSIQSGLGPAPPSFNFAGGPPRTPHHELGPPASAGIFSSPMAFFSTPGPAPPPIQEQFPVKELPTSSPQSVSLICANSPASPPPPLSTPMPNLAPPNPPPATISIQGPTPPAHPPMFAPPPVASASPLPTSAKKRPSYAPLPYLNSTPAPEASAQAPVYNLPGMPPLPEPKSFQPIHSQPPSIPPSNSAPNLPNLSSQVFFSTSHFLRPPSNSTLVL